MMQDVSYQTSVSYQCVDFDLCAIMLLFKLQAEMLEDSSRVDIMELIRTELERIHNDVGKSTVVKL